MKNNVLTILDPETGRVIQIDYRCMGDDLEGIAYETLEAIVEHNGFDPSQIDFMFGDTPLFQQRSPKALDNAFWDSIERDECA
jgi:hypothetical protein